MFFLITAHSTMASARATHFASQLFRISFFMTLGEERFEPGPERLRVEVSFDPAAVTNGNDARLLRDDDDHRVALLGEPERGAVPQAERAVEVALLADRKDAGRRDDAVVADDQPAVVQRSFWKKNADD